MRTLSVYQAAGFRLISDLAPGGMFTYPADAVKIEKGYAVHDNGSGYATDTTTAFSSAFLGIAAAECDNSAGSAGDLNVTVIKPLPEHVFAVPCAANDLMAQTDIGTYIDLEAAGTVDNSDATIASGPGFFVDDIDVTTEAVAANTYGYAIGHFQYQS